MTFSMRFSASTHLVLDRDAHPAAYFCPRKETCSMDANSDLRTLRLLEGYLTDLICEVKKPSAIDLLTQALLSLQWTLRQSERSKGMVA